MKNKSSEDKAPTKLLTIFYELANKRSAFKKKNFPSLKRICALVVVLLVFTIASADGIELACEMGDPDPEIPPGLWYEQDVMQYHYLLNKCDTDTNASELIRRGYSTHVSVVPDGKIYFVSWAREFIDYGHFMQWTITAAYIKRLYPNHAADGHIEYVGEEELYEIPLTPENQRPQWSDLVVRTIEPGVDRVYFSQACGSCGDGYIYYIDDIGETQLYYTVRLDEMPNPGCGLGGYWSGNFFFDEDDNLYLSSGNHVPSSLFRVAGAGPDTVNPDNYPVLIHEQPFPWSLEKFVLEDSDQLYFQDSLSGPIYRLTLGDLEPETVLADRVNGFDVLEVPSGGSTEPAPARKALRVINLPTFPSEPSGRVKKIHKGPPEIGIVNIEAGDPIFLDGGKTATIPVRVFLRNSGEMLNDYQITTTVTFDKKNAPINASFVTAGQAKKQIRQKILRTGEEVAVCGNFNFKHPSGESLFGKQIFSNIIVETQVAEHDKRNNRAKLNLRLPDIVH